MNNSTNYMTHNNINFDICDMQQLIEIGASTPLTLESNYYLEMTSFCIASVIGLLSVLYNFVIKKRGFTLHFVGLGRPKSFNKSQYKLLDNIDTSHTMITLRTSLKDTDTIFTLKQFIQKTYNISDENDLLILYSHHIISDNSATLKNIGITDNSLLQIAICDENKVIPPADIHENLNENEQKQEQILAEPEQESESESESEYNGDAVNAMFEMYEDYESDPEPVTDVNELFGMFQDYESESDNENEALCTPPPPPTWPRLGFDIITQEHNVLVHKMPKCGHEMNTNSLYQYALSTFSDSSNMHLKCPHSMKCDDNTDKLCDTKWQYSSITDILQYKENKDTWINGAKLELLSSRNVIENDGNFQKCPRCKTVYFRNMDDNKKALDEIKTVEDIENEFKFKCVVCPDKTIEYILKIKLENEEKEKEEQGGHNEDDIKEDINGNDINDMFGNNYDSDDSDEEEDENEEKEALDVIAHMFDDDGMDYDENIIVKHLNEFCFCCGVEWDNGHICDSSFKADLCEILSSAEMQKIGSVDNVPSIRCCPNCCQLIFHVDACKHMKCGGCKIDFCFVCMKPKKDGRWQCGSSSDVCPIAPIQNMDTLPDTIVITKKSFQLY